VHPHILCKHKLLFWMRFLSKPDPYDFITVMHIFSPHNHHFKTQDDYDCNM